MEVKDTYVADVSRYSGPLREAANRADEFADKNDKAALAARKMGLAASEAANKAARAQRDAADAAEKLAKGEIEAGRAADAAAKAEREVERASIAAAEAQRATAKAADTAADNYRQLARDAELAAAAEQLGSLKASGSVKEHNALVLKLRKDMPELGKDGSKAFTLMSSASGTFGKSLGAATSSMESLSGAGKLMPGLIITGLELLPAAAAAAGGAITLGLGGAIAGVGILAASKNAQIRAEYSTLGKAMFGHIQADAQPFVATLEHIGQYAEDEFKSWEPLVKSAFSTMAPEVDSFAHQAIRSLDQFKPAFDAIVKGFGVQLKGLGPQLAPSMHNIAVGIQAIGEAAQKNPEALGELAHDLSLIVRAGGDVIGFFTRFEGQINMIAETANAFAVGPLGTMALGLYKLKNLASGGVLSHTSEELVNFGGAATGAAGAMDSTGMATQSLLSSQKVATMTTDQLKAALDRLTGANQNAFDAQTQYANALTAANEQAKKSNAGFDGSSKAIQLNRQALSQLAMAFKSDLGDKTPAQIDKMRQAFINAAVGMGASKQRAKELADELLGVAGNMKKIPDKKDTKLGATDNTKPAVASAKKGTDGFANKIYKAQLTAQSKISGAVHSAISSADGFAHKLYRAQLTAQSKVSGVVSSATGLAKRFANGFYQAQLRATNLAAGAFNSAMSYGRSWAGRVFTAFLNIKKLFASGGIVEGYADGGPVRDHYPTGGPISGPGTGTSDSIPIMASNGEYVVNAEQTRKHRQLLDAINYGLDGYASGGKVKAPTAAQKAAAAATVTRAKARPEELAAMAAQQSLEAMRSSVYGGFFRGGASTIGSAHGSVVQHVTHIDVHVSGSVVSNQQLIESVRRGLAQRSVYNGGTNGASVPRTV